MIKKCSQCKKDFKTSKFMTKYCGRKCYALRRAKPKITKKCLVCNTIFHVRTGLARRKLCSRKCSNIYKSKIFYKKCQICGTQFATWPARERWSIAKYCSRSCYHKSRRTNGYLVKKTRNSLEYKKWIGKIKARDGHRCQGCGCIDGPLHAHHIVPMAEDLSKALDLDNGVTLCVPCHQLEHPGNPLIG